MGEDCVMCWMGWRDSVVRFLPMYRWIGYVVSLTSYDAAIQVQTPRRKTFPDLSGMRTLRDTYEERPFFVSPTRWIQKTPTLAFLTGWDERNNNIWKDVVLGKCENEIRLKDGKWSLCFSSSELERRELTTNFVATVQKIWWTSPNLILPSFSSTSLVPPIHVTCRTISSCVAADMKVSMHISFLHRMGGITRVFLLALKRGGGEGRI